ncbi:UDP-N-acetylglucosamine 4,6-dehydratase (inverting) [Candidatus Kaiserbacteria bacterium RIFCSPLOWO2_01_FULL_54_20]|uniref:UDP-N-acetylglucosamine 4,6-dehydratase (Inverting) n=1 Tax=Candidatus Kaiserbacteria bacterium RIFCSPLOWO2_01_FULL_54_20 TaxID=1798513 RepID=A0A1F6EJS9_9BACT|nr:MAG: UDP-N-acetylglucosamine 4,6-dehydratase (inverting) [Candidatus Kaiserbacteria bacterium RIFCSPLOWO2_01_FULL_54_20]
MARRSPSKSLTVGTFLKGKTILITGGTGTFGHALVARLLIEKAVRKIIILSRDELKQSQLQHLYPNESRLRYFLGDVRDKERLMRAFRGVDIVVHAAALKQVPATEYNPFEAVKTNIVGTQNVIDAAIDQKVLKVLLVSSDKAVEPINLYGATKMCAEKLCVAANVYGAGSTALSVIRYGNVIGSRGSLVELIEKQRAGGVITITDGRMTRFWINIHQVMDIVLECLDVMKGGEIFVPKMKSAPVRDVMELIAPDCKIKTIGIRPGEKIHEMLITQYECGRTHELAHMYVIRPEFGAYDPAWLARTPAIPKDFSYGSGNKDFKLTEAEAKTLFKR